MASNNYGGYIWTNHALDRLYERRCPQDYALQAVLYPDEAFPGKRPGTSEYRKKIGAHTITLIVTTTENNEPLVISAWADPPFPGSADFSKKNRYQQYRKAGFWGKMWMHVLKQVFGKGF